LTLLRRTRFSGVYYRVATIVRCGNTPTAAECGRGRGGRREGGRMAIRPPAGGGVSPRSKTASTRRNRIGERARRVFASSRRLRGGERNQRAGGHAIVDATHQRTANRESTTLRRRLKSAPTAPYCECVQRHPLTGWVERGLKALELINIRAAAGRSSAGVVEDLVLVHQPRRRRQQRIGLRRIDLTLLEDRSPESFERPLGVAGA
jgi:hypothetical protein